MPKMISKKNVAFVIARAVQAQLSFGLFLFAKMQAIVALANATSPRS
jgi:hypothetical protein